MGALSQSSLDQGETTFRHCVLAARYQIIRTNSYCSDSRNFRLISYMVRTTVAIDTTKGVELIWCPKTRRTISQGAIEGLWWGEAAKIRFGTLGTGLR
jgi:hypothetical protein